MAASRGLGCVRSLRGGVLWRIRYGQAGGCWGRDQHRPSQALGKEAISHRQLAASSSDRKGTEPPFPRLETRCYKPRRGL